VPPQLFTPHTKLALQPRDPLPWEGINLEWVAKNAKDFDPSGIATFYPINTPATINRFLCCGKPLKEPPEYRVHLIVTMRRQEQQQKRKDEEKRDTLSDIRLMHRSEVLSAIKRYALLTLNVYTQITSLSSRALTYRRHPLLLNQANMPNSRQTPRQSSTMASTTSAALSTPRLFQ